MSAVKRAYQNWCEQNNVEPEDNIEWLQTSLWVEQFDNALSKMFAPKPQGDDNEQE